MNSTPPHEEKASSAAFLLLMIGTLLTLGGCFPPPDPVSALVRIRTDKDTYMADETMVLIIEPTYRTSKGKKIHDSEVYEEYILKDPAILTYPKKGQDPYRKPYGSHSIRRSVYPVVKLTEGKYRLQFPVSELGFLGRRHIRFAAFSSLTMNAVVPYFWVVMSENELAISIENQ